MADHRPILKRDPLFSRFLDTAARPGVCDRSSRLRLVLVRTRASVAPRQAWAAITFRLRASHPRLFPFLPIPSRRLSVPLYSVRVRPSAIARWRDVHIYTYALTLAYIYMCMYICAIVCVSICIYIYTVRSSAARFLVRPSQPPRNPQLDSTRRNPLN